jgi:hypothetical protein
MTEERLRRWRLLLGEDEGIGHTLSGEDAARDRVLAALYDTDETGERTGGLGASAPRVARWLGDVRTYFPSRVVRVMQQDAMDRLGLHQLLLEPEMLDAVEPDIHLVGTLLSLTGVIPAKSRETARAIVRKVVDDLERRLEQPTARAVPAGRRRSTGRARSPPTCATTSPTTGR